MSGNLPFTASVEAQLDAFANAYFRPIITVPGRNANGENAVPDVNAQQLVLILLANSCPSQYKKMTYKNITINTVVTVRQSMGSIEPDPIDSFFLTRSEEA